MANSYFKFKQFTINQTSAAMKVGTDGVLLGAWANIESAGTILDIGTGTGLIAIMVAQRNNTALIEAVEVEEMAFRQAQENIQNCPWHNRIKVYLDSFQKFQGNCTKIYDSIISNPPYFNNSLLPDITERGKARHSEYLPHNELLLGVHKILSPDKGRFSIILPAMQEADFTRLAEKTGLFCNKKLWIKANTGKTEYIRVLLEYSLLKQNKCAESELSIEVGRHIYTNEYKNLTKDFYIKF